MLKTYSVYTALDAKKKDFRKTATVKATTFYEAAVNAAHFFGWTDTSGMILTNKTENHFREYQLRNMIFDVVLKENSVAA